MGPRDLEDIINDIERDDDVIDHEVDIDRIDRYEDEEEPEVDEDDLTFEQRWYAE